MQYQTKDSGKRESFDSGMVRDTQEGKPRFDLLMPKGVPFNEQILTRFAALMERGAHKYGERNWEKGNSQVELDRAIASALRHMLQWIAGETDEDHAAAVLFNIMQAETLRYKMNEVELFVNTSPVSFNPLPSRCALVCISHAKACTKEFGHSFKHQHDEHWYE